MRFWGKGRDFPSRWSQEEGKADAAVLRAPTPQWAHHNCRGGSLLPAPTAGVLAHRFSTVLMSIHHCTDFMPDQGTPMTPNHPAAHPALGLHLSSHSRKTMGKTWKSLDRFQVPQSYPIPEQSQSLSPPESQQDLDTAEHVTEAHLPASRRLSISQEKKNKTGMIGLKSHQKY